MPQPIRAIAFDVIETLFSLEPLRPRIVALGLPPDALELWFAQTLRDGFATAAAGSFQPFPIVASAALQVLLATHAKPADQASVDSVMSGFAELTPHADVGPTLTMLRQRQVPVYAVSNGTSQSTTNLLRKAGLDDLVAGVVSIDDVKLWKPRREVYHHVAQRAGVAPGELALVAAHAWDVHGAKQAGLVGAWVRRKEKLFSSALGPPDLTADELLTLCRQLVGA